MSRVANRTRFERALINIAAFVILVAGMRAAAPILVPFLFAIFVAVIITPLFIALRRMGMRSGFALLIISLGLVGMGFLAVQVAGNALNDFTKKLPAYQRRLQTQEDNFVAWLKSKGIEVPRQAASKEPSGAEDAVGANNNAEIMLNPQAVLRYAGNLAATLSSLFGKGMIIMLVVIFILLEVAILPGRIRQVPGLTEELWDQLMEMTDNVRQYMVMKTVMSLVTGVLVWLWLEVLGVDYALLLGMLAFGLNFIPAIGSIIASIPGILLALVLFGPGSALLCAIGYLVINIGISNFIEPRYMGRGLRLSPLTILLSVIFWGWVLGPLGMLLSVPITMATKIILESSADTVWLALLLGPPAVKKRPPADVMEIPAAVDPESESNP